MRIYLDFFLFAFSPLRFHSLWARFTHETYAKHEPKLQESQSELKVEKPSNNEKKIRIFHVYENLTKWKITFHKATSTKPDQSDKIILLHSTHTDTYERTYYIIKYRC